MKGFLLILLVTFFVPLQCNKSNHFFVTRRDTNEAICIEPNTSDYTKLPTFDLDKLQIPRDVGFKYWDWLSDWQLQNDTDVRTRDGYKSVLIAGNQPFHFVAQANRGAYVHILASNISLWVADKHQPHRGAGMLFELDHLNETTKLKDTTLKYCDHNPEVEGVKCSVVDYKNGTNLLNDGNRWTHFRIKEDSTGVEIKESSYGYYKLVVKWTWNNANISDLFTSSYFDVFAKSHQRNAAISPLFGFNPNLSSNIEMKRNYTKRSSGKFCVRVTWNEDFSDGSNELMEVKNLASGRVQPATNTTHNILYNRWAYYQWNHLHAGEYEFTLRFDKKQPVHIDLCQDDDSEIVKTWMSTPKAIIKCQYNVGFTYEFSAWPCNIPDPTLKPIWTLEDWAYVCDQLGIGPNDTEVQIKFCNWKGCNFSKCPHLQHEPPYIFDF